MQGKKFISPGAWFSMNYPSDWNEFEDGEECFLFYNPDVWTGNFRISAFKGGKNYGQQVLRQELNENSSAVRVKLGAFECAYSKEMFEENEAYYTSHFWVIGIDDMAFECSFTVLKGGDATKAEDVIASIEVRKEGQKYPAELIPIRLVEICAVNESYEWVANLVKEKLSADFQGVEGDLVKLQQLIDNDLIGPKKRDEWLSVGIATCVILANEADGMEWKTLIDGNREAPVLVYKEQVIDPMKLTWSKIKAGEPCNLIEAYKKLW